MAKRTDLELAEKYLGKAKSCVSRNIKFDLSFDEYRELLQTHKCYYTGVVMEHNGKGQKGLTIDRIDNKLGYIAGNVVACSKVANSTKNHLLEAGGLSIPQVRVMLTKINKIIMKKNEDTK